MQNFIGTFYEFALCQHLCHAGIKIADTASKTVFNQMKTRFAKHSIGKSMQTTTMLAQMEKIILKLESSKFPFVKLLNHREGSSNNILATTADLVMLCKDQKITQMVSIKHNNMYVKHHKPNKLGLQMKLNSVAKESFEKQYATINNAYVKKWSRLTTFSQVPSGEKIQLYKKINELTKFYLLKFRPWKYIDFLLDQKTKFVCKFGGPTGVQLLKKKYLRNKTVDTIKVDGSKICIKLVNGISINMRLHTAQSRITPTLCMKYEVTLKDYFTRIV
jgi:hypothetical protein